MFLSPPTLVCALLLFAVPLSAQETSVGTFKGQVLAAGSPLPGAEVRIAILNASTTTDSVGGFNFNRLPVGTHIVEVRRLGFAPLSDSIVIFEAESVSRTFTLSAITQLDTVKTTDAKPQYWTPRLQEFERRRTSPGGSGRFISEAELRQTEGVSLPSVLRRIPGLSFQSYQGKTYARSRGSSSIAGDLPIDATNPGSPKGCWSAVYLDGQLVFDGRPGRGLPSFDLGSVFVANLAGVEFYSSPSTTPMQFRNPTSNCGTLLLWMRAR